MLPSWRVSSSLGKGLQTDKKSGHTWQSRLTKTMFRQAGCFTEPTGSPEGKGSRKEEVSTTYLKGQKTKLGRKAEMGLTGQEILEPILLRP